VQRDGRIVVAANSESELGAGPAFVIARYSADGTLDRSTRTAESWWSA